MILSDEGYFFGIGAFETIGVEEGKPMFWEAHLQRLSRAAAFLKLPFSREAIEEKVERSLKAKEMSQGRMVLKITLSEKNLLVSTRKNTYEAADYHRGFQTELSPVFRNETSPLVYHKTLNYGDCLLEKRRAKAQGIDEPIFRNSRGQLCEGAATNLFFVKEGRLITPSLHCGLLPGIFRAYLCKNYQVEEREIFMKEIPEFQEMFLTNSLMGIMPVSRLGEYEFPTRKKAGELLLDYQKLCRKAR